MNTRCGGDLSGEWSMDASDLLDGGEGDDRLLGFGGNDMLAGGGGRIPDRRRRR